jgi:hypothetical protein
LTETASGSYSGSLLSEVVLKVLGYECEVSNDALQIDKWKKNIFFDYCTD